MSVKSQKSKVELARVLAKSYQFKERMQQMNWPSLDVEGDSQSKI
jgi:hypothetical protein